jgi:uncharacterized membrane protein YcjF (UPF0283 family)
MQLTGAVLAVLGMGLIVLAAVQALMDIFGKSSLLALIFAGAGAVLLVVGAVMLLRENDG